MILRLSGVIKESIVDGPGLRLAVFTQGCPHNCPGCHNPKTHDFSGGFIADTEKLLAAIDKNPLLSGITLSGGEPLCQAAQLLPFVSGAKDRGKDIFCYTGYTFEHLITQSDPDIMNLLSKLDILIDGPYIESQRNLELRFRGSDNQRVLNMPASLAAGTAIWAEGYL